MASFILCGINEDEELERAEALGNFLQSNLPDFHVQCIFKESNEWPDFFKETVQSKGWRVNTAEIPRHFVWRTSGAYIGNANDFISLVRICSSTIHNLDERKLPQDSELARNQRLEVTKIKIIPHTKIIAKNMSDLSRQLAKIKLKRVKGVKNANKKSEKTSAIDERKFDLAPKQVKDDTPKAFKRLFVQKPSKIKDNTEKVNMKIARGESLYDFNERVHEEYQNNFVTSIKESRSIRNKRKEHLKKRQERIKKNTEEKKEMKYEQVEFEKIPFGQVAEQPPIISVVPREKIKPVKVVKAENPARAEIIQRYKEVKKAREMDRIRKAFKKRKVTSKFDD